MPFLNVFKGASTNEKWGASGVAFNALAPWCTLKDATTWDTDETAYLQLDADGYPTSLIASPTPPGGQRFTAVSTWMGLNQPYLAPGATEWYPSGSYTLSFQGAGTVVIGGGVAGLNSDISTKGFTSTGGLTVTAPGGATGPLTIVSTMAAGVVGSVTFDVPKSTQNGLSLLITALPDSANHIRDISIVQTAYLHPFTYEGRAYPGYLAGQLYHPRFLTAMRMFSRVRCMDWLKANNQDWGVSFTADLAKGATGGSIKNMASVGGAGPASGFYTFWPQPSGVYRWAFATGQMIDVTCTMGSADVRWETPLSAAVGVKQTPGGEMAFVPMLQSFEKRPLLSNAMWSGLRGIPLEACLQLGNELGVDIWLCLPATTLAVTGGEYARSVARLAYDGAGGVVTGSNLTSFKGLATAQKCYVEYEPPLTALASHRVSPACPTLTSLSSFLCAPGTRTRPGEPTPART